MTDNQTGEGGGTQPKKHGWWRTVPKAGVSSTVATSLLVIVGVWGVIATGQSLQLSERAWVSVVSAQVNPTPAGLPLHYHVAAVNSGKQPALDVAFSQDTGEIAVPPGNDLNGVTLRENTTCRGLAPLKGGGIIAPGTTMFRNTDSGRGEHPVFIDKNFLNGDSMIFVQGCVAYRTFNTIHHTGYCLVIIPVMGYPPPPAAAPAPSSNATAPNPPPPVVTPAGASSPSTSPPAKVITSVEVDNCPTGNTAD